MIKKKKSNPHYFEYQIFTEIVTTVHLKIYILYTYVHVHARA